MDFPFAEQEYQVSIQLISLASRELPDTKAGNQQFYVSIQLISLASREQVFSEDRAYCPMFPFN